MTTSSVCLGFCEGLSSTLNRVECSPSSDRFMLVVSKPYITNSVSILPRSVILSQSFLVNFSLKKSSVSTDVSDSITSSWLGILSPISCVIVENSDSNFSSFKRASFSVIEAVLDKSSSAFSMASIFDLISLSLRMACSTPSRIETVWSRGVPTGRATSKVNSL